MVRTWLGALEITAVVAGLVVGAFASACSERANDDGGEGGAGRSAGAAGTVAGKGGTNTSGGSAGHAGAGAAGGTNTSGGTAGGASGGATGGANASGGTAGDASGATGGTGTSGGSAGDTSGGATGGATGGTSGSGGDWAAACNGVTMVGRCVGEVYEWCDYFERGLKRIDCGAMGLTCQAEPRELGSDFTNAGCFGATCTSEDDRCDGMLAFQCLDGENTVHDCTKHLGPEATCGDGSVGNGRCRSAFCEPERRVYCDGNVAVVCGLDNVFYLENCAEHDPAGTCVEMDPMWVVCGGRNVQTP